MTYFHIVEENSEEFFSIAEDFLCMCGILFESEYKQ